MNSRDSSEELTDEEQFSDTQALELIVEEARREYEQEIATIDEVDDKAMRSVRTAVLIIGFVASAVGIAGPSAIAAASTPTTLGLGAGIVALLGSVLIGIGTYTVTEYPSGVGSDFRSTALREATVYRAEAHRVVQQYEKMTDEVALEVATNSGLLETVQLLLWAGITLLALAAGVYVLVAAYGIHPWIAFLVGFLAVAVLMLLVVRLMNEETQTSARP